MTSDKCKQSLYFPAEMIEEMNAEAARIDRSLSWLVQHCWRLAKPDIEKMPDAEAAFTRGQ